MYSDPIKLATLAVRADPTRGFSGNGIGGNSLSQSSGESEDEWYMAVLPAKTVAKLNKAQRALYDLYHPDAPAPGTSGAAVIDYGQEPQLEYEIPQLGYDPVAEATPEQAPAQPEAVPPVVPMKKRGNSSLTINTTTYLAARSSDLRDAQQNIPAARSSAPDARRVEEASTCKPRPEDTKPKAGGGQSRPYVPWCERKR